MATITLSDEQLKKLTELMFLGEWVLNSFKDPNEALEFEDVEQIVYKAVSQTQYADIVEFDETENAYFVSSDFDDECMDKIEEYDEKAFWSELLAQLADRDLLEKFGMEIRLMDEMKLMEERNKIVEKYEIEFEANGIDNFVIKKHK